MKHYVIILLVCFSFGCVTIPKEYILVPSEVAIDPTYGYSKDNPINVGGVVHDRGPRNEIIFLSNLISESGEKPTFNRRGSCCPIHTQFGYDGRGLLDIYELVIPSKNDTIILYLNMYDYEKPKIPKGFRIKNSVLNRAG